jgi:sec-independent protein translocase protein TatA
MNLSVTEILAIIVVGLVLFGGKLPDVARNLGATMKEFKEGMHDDGDADDQDDEEEPERVIDQDATPEQDQQDQDSQDQA